MNLTTILHPTDFSPFSDAALQYASVLAAESSATLLVVHIEEDVPAYVPGYGGFGHIPAVVDHGESMDDRLNKIEPTVANVECRHKLLHGQPADEILRLAEGESADLIVMGTHGRTGMARLLMGSVAEAVVRRAKCPVLTLKQPAAVPQVVGTT